MNNRLIFIALLFTTTVLFGQKINNARLKYKVSFKEIKNKNGVNNFFNSKSQQIYLLDIQNSKSLFYPEKRMTSDSQTNFDLISAFVGKNNYYFDSSKNILLKKEHHLGEDFIIREIPDFKWILTQESKKIGNYICFKATCEVQYLNRLGKDMSKIVTAWYTTQIPLNFGIKNYCGLPGLTLFLDEGELIYELLEINLNINDKLDIIEPKGGKMISKKEYTNILIDSYNKNFRKF